jgi:sugar phosphate isomerase/epimerase
MRFGVCAPVGAAGALASAGYDYIELNVAVDLIPDDDDAAWSEKRQAIEAMALPVEVLNSFVRTGKIVGPEADPDRLKRYVDCALERARTVGASRIIFGSAGARNVPEGYPRDRAMDEIRHFLRLSADASDRTGVVVCIEPLEKGESNILNLVSEGAALAREIGRPGVRNLADTWHMECENEPLQAIVDSMDVLAHVHTADSRRDAPGTGSYDHAAMFRALRAAGYDARVSIEGNLPQEPEAFAEQVARSLAHLKTAYESA